VVADFCAQRGKEKDKGRVSEGGGCSGSTVENECDGKDIVKVSAS